MTREDRPPDRDEFEGIDISGPWGGVRIGSGGVRVGGSFSDWGDDDAETRVVRRRVRQRLEFFKNLTYYVLIVGALAIVDGLTGGGYWVQWLALIWGAFLGMQFVGNWLGPALWGREAEERMVEEEMRRRRGSIHVTPPPDDDPP